MRPLKTDFRTDTLPLGRVIPLRRATPAFKPDPVPEETLQEALELATLAPSGYNLQPWRFIVVRDPKNRARLSAAAFNQPKVAQAPVVVIACGDTAGWKNGDLDAMIADAKASGYLKDVKTEERVRNGAASLLRTTDLRVWATRSTMIAFTYLMLAAESLGLDTAPMEGFDEAKVREAFAIPETVAVVALLAIGTLQEPDKPYGGRFDLEKVVFAERFGRAWSAAPAASTHAGRAPSAGAVRAEAGPSREEPGRTDRRT